MQHPGRLLTLIPVDLQAHRRQVDTDLIAIQRRCMYLAISNHGHRERTDEEPLAPTPTLDALADAGMWFTDAHSPASLCTPSRYAFMSGNYNFRSYSPSGVWNAYGLNAIAVADTTLGSVVQAVGYQTGFVGKWHFFWGTTTRRGRLR